MERRENSDPFILKLIEKNTKLLTKSLKVEGWDNLKKIPNEKSVIFVTTHLSNLDVATVYGLLARNYRLKIIQASTHNSFLQSPSGFMASRVAGKDNFLTINTQKNNGKERGVFDQKDYKPIIDHLKKEGNGVVIAAYYNPDKKYFGNLSQNNVVLPEKGGVGAVFLAQKTDAALIPVAIDVDENRNAVVRIGCNLNLQKIEGLEKLREDLNETKRIFKEMRIQSDMVMNSFAKMMPEKKRGNWN